MYWYPSSSCNIPSHYSTIFLYILSGSHATTCVPCAVGKTSTDPFITCDSQCAAGKYGQWNTAAARPDCINCPVGKYSAVVGAASEVICSLCPQGLYGATPGATTFDQCLSCPKGKYGQRAGLVQPTDCTLIGYILYSIMV